MSTITIMYTCQKCGITKQPLNVPERLRAVDVDFWIQMTGNRVAKDHDERRPDCRNDKIDLTIPVSEDATMIGRMTE